MTEALKDFGLTALYLVMAGIVLLAILNIIRKLFESER